jgi:two-component system sensor histidine kinase UhpB
VIEAIRSISKRLVIPESHIIGVFENIKNLIKDLKKVSPVKIEFATRNVQENDLTEKQQITVFRIVQEQVNNILKHANASNAAINLSRDSNEIILLITDDGSGYDISEASKGVGLINIRSRAKLSRGNMTIVSKPGEGFELKVVLPLEVFF